MQRHKVRGHFARYGLEGVDFNIRLPSFVRRAYHRFSITTKILDFQ